MIHLSAELFARSIIASAVNIGELTVASRDPNRITCRSVYPAVVALATETKRPLTDICRILLCTAAEVVIARQASPDEFRRAKEAAREAARYHLIHRAEVALTAAPPAPEPEPLPPPAPKLDMTHAPVRFQKAPPPRIPTTARERILQVLEHEPMSPSGLASLLDIKELTVSQIIPNLEREGLIVPCEMPEAGRRFQHWRARTMELA